MADEPVVEPVVEPAAEPVVAPVTPVVTDFFGADGTLKDGWMGTLDEDLREDKSLMSYKTVQALAKSNAMTKKMVGKNVVAILNDASTQGEIDAYQEGGGRPKTAADYDLKMPDDFPEELATQFFPEDEVSKWKERLFKNGVSQKGADNIVKELAGDLLGRIQATEQTTEAAKAEVMTALTTEYGAAFDQKMHLGDMAMEDFTGGDEAMKESLAHLRKDPLAIRMMVHFGGMLAEGKPPGFAAIPTPGDYQDQVDALMADPLYTAGTKKQRMNIASKILAIKKLQMPEPV